MSDPETRREPEQVDWAERERLFAELYGPPADGADGEYARDYRPIHPEPAWRGLVRKLGAPLIALGLLLWKFKFALFAIFKLKIFTVAGSMLVSVGAYALLWGWQFAVGFVALLFVHEMGHVLEARRQGLPVSAPMFIPFLGAMILLKRMPDNAFKEAQGALAGPIVGSLGAAACWAVGVATGHDYWIALAFVGFLLNLFNLLPITPLDGGRAVGAIHPALWILGLAGLLGMAFLWPNPIILVILLFGAMDAWTRWQRRNEPEQARYYAIPAAQRLAVGAVYLGLAATLMLAMGATHLERDI
jgi:Zn-dependent protease